MNTITKEKQEAVKLLAHSSYTAKAFFLVCAERERNRHRINVALWKRYIRNRMNLFVRDSEYYGLLRELQHLGLGKIDYVRNEPAHFTFLVPMEHIADAAQVTEKDLALPKRKKRRGRPPRTPIGLQRQDSDRPSEPQGNIIGKESKIVLVIPMESGELKRVEMSSNIDAEDMKRIVSIIQKSDANQQQKETAGEQSVPSANA